MVSAFEVLLSLIDVRNERKSVQILLSALNAACQQSPVGSVSRFKSLLRHHVIDVQNLVNCIPFTYSMLGSPDP